MLIASYYFLNCSSFHCTCINGSKYALTGYPFLYSSVSLSLWRFLKAHLFASFSLDFFAETPPMLFRVVCLYFFATGSTALSWKNLICQYNVYCITCLFIELLLKTTTSHLRMKFVVPSFRKCLAESVSIFKSKSWMYTYT